MGQKVYKEEKNGKEIILDVEKRED